MIVNVIFIGGLGDSPAGAVISNDAGGAVDDVQAGVGGVVVVEVCVVCSAEKRARCAGAIGVLALLGGVQAGRRDAADGEGFIVSLGLGDEAVVECCGDANRANVYQQAIVQAGVLFAGIVCCDLLEQYSRGRRALIRAYLCLYCAGAGNGVDDHVRKNVNRIIAVWICYLRAPRAVG